MISVLRDAVCRVAGSERDEELHDCKQRAEQKEAETCEKSQGKFRTHCCYTAYVQKLNRDWYPCFYLLVICNYKLREH